MTPVGWSVLSQGLPEKPTRDREDLILGWATGGQLLPITWVPIEMGSPERAVVFYASDDALKIGTPEDYCRFNITASGAQVLCDALGFLMQTTKTADIIHQKATVIIQPCTQKPDNQMAYTFRMLQHSQAVDKAVAGRTGLISTVGKDWVLTNRLAGHPDRAANFGWHTPHGQYRSPGGLPVYQPLGTAHDRYHVDYSQVFRPLRDITLVDGSPWPLKNVLTDPELAPMVSYEGVLEITRMPGVSPKES